MRGSWDRIQEILGTIKDFGAAAHRALSRKISIITTISWSERFETMPHQIDEPPRAVRQFGRKRSVSLPALDEDETNRRQP